MPVMKLKTAGFQSNHSNNSQDTEEPLEGAFYCIEFYPRINRSVKLLEITSFSSGEKRSTIPASYLYLKSVGAPVSKRMCNETVCI